MCGIVGYIGDKNAYEIVINGLRRLEYRGYDSSGIALYNSELNVCKTKGKVEKLVKKAKKNISLEANIGIGHTRWATHGEPNNVNAHPLISNNGSLVIVHNGIIENYATIKNELIGKGYNFKSETDTEVLVNLIEYVQETENVKLGKAVQLALSQVVGAYAIAVFDKKEARIYDATTTIVSASEDPILVAPCCQDTGLWKLNLDYEV
jgi:glucosamine--fructose-6-phosphate aminotransferase (isomerizing)